MSDPTAKLFDMAEKVVHHTLFCTDDQAAQYIDWDLVADAYEILVELAKKGRA